MRPQKGPKRPPQQKQQQRRESTSSLSSAPNLSDEDGYSGIDDVPDSDDDDDEHVFAAEMEHIISLRRGAPHSSSRPVHRSDDDDSDSDDDDADEESIMDENFSLDESGSGLAESSSNISHIEDAIPESTTLQESPDQPAARHVRFTGVPDSDSDSEQSDYWGDLFPDLLVPQSALDPSFRKEIEKDDDSDCDASETYWDHNEPLNFSNQYEQEDTRMNSDPPGPWRWGPYGPIETPLDSNSHNGVVPGTTAAAPLDIHDEESSDGYECMSCIISIVTVVGLTCSLADGETTEEDEPVLIRTRQDSPESPVSGPVSPTDKGKSPAGRLLIPSRRKPICIVNPVTRKMMVIRPPPRRPKFSGLAFDQSAFPGLLPADSSPMKNDNVMFSQPLPFNNMPWFPDPAEGSAFNNFGFSFDQALGDSGEESFNDEDVEDDGEKNLNIEDFLDLEGLEDKDDEEAVEAEEGDIDGVETPSRRPSTSTNGQGNGLSGSGLHNHALLKHLKSIDRVGAFRINQANQKLILNGQATQDSLAFSNSLYHGTLRGIKQGNLKGASTPLTPERRHKKAFAKSPLETTQVKRKAPEVDSNSSNGAHKRHRSLSDIYMAN